MGIAESITRADWEQDSNYEIVMKNGLFVALPNPVPIFVLKGFSADTAICFFFSLDDVGLEKRLFSFLFLLLPRGPCDPSCTKRCILERPGPSRGDGHIHSPTDGAAPNNTCRFIMTKLALLAAHRAGSPAPSGLESP